MADIQLETVEKKVPKKATMADVARHAGVALSTVSHVMNGTATISEETKKRVLDSVKKLNYTPNAFARSLRKKRTNSIGVIVPDIENEFYANVVSTIFQLSDAVSDTISLVDTGYSLQREQINIEALVQRQVDGIILIGGSGDERILSWLRHKNVPVVLGDRRCDGYCSVEFDNYNTMRRLVKWVYDKGYRKIGYISESPDMTNLKDRYRGLQEGLQECSLSSDEQWILKDSWLKLEKMDVSQKVMRKLITNIKREGMPEVFLTSSDMIAVGALDALLQSGYRVPEDISVVGYDDIRISQYYHPAITTVHQDRSRLGEECLRLLKKVMENIDYKECIQLETHIVERKSTH